MPVAFAIIAAPFLFFMVVWAIVTAYRIYIPEQVMPLERDPFILRQRAATEGVPVPVGAREIREDQQLRQRNAFVAPYHYAWGCSERGVPEAWVEDVWLRRN